MSHFSKHRHGPSLYPHKFPAIQHSSDTGVNPVTITLTANHHWENQMLGGAQPAHWDWGWGDQLVRTPQWPHGGRQSRRGQPVAGYGVLLWSSEGGCPGLAAGCFPPSPRTDRILWAPTLWTCWHTVDRLHLRWHAVAPAGSLLCNRCPARGAPPGGNSMDNGRTNWYL